MNLNHTGCSEYDYLFVLTKEDCSFADCIRVLLVQT